MARGLTQGINVGGTFSCYSGAAGNWKRGEVTWVVWQGRKTKSQYGTLASRATREIGAEVGWDLRGQTGESGSGHRGEGEQWCTITCRKGGGGNRL